MATITPQTNLTHATFIPEVWSADMLVNRKNKLVVAEHVTRHDKEVLNYGDTIHVPRVGASTAKTTTPGAEIDFDANTEGELAINIDTRVYSSFMIPDMLKAQSKYDNRKIYIEEASFAIAKKVDTDLHTLVTATTEITNSVGSTVSTTATLAKTFFTRINRYFDVANAPDDERYFVVDGYGYEQLLNIDDFVKYDAQGKAGKIENGKVGSLYGLNLLKSNQVLAKTTNVRNGIAFHKSGIALAMQIKENVRSEYVIQRLSNAVAAYNQYGSAIARTDHVVNFFYGIG